MEENEAEISQALNERFQAMITRKAFDNGGLVFSIIGDYTGKMKNFSHHCEIIRSTNYGLVEDAHMYFCHVISQILKEEAQERYVIK